MPVVPVMPSPVQVEVEGVEQATALAGGIAIIDKPENKSEAVKVSETDLGKFRPNLLMKVERLSDSFI
jgi:hypothetical protein